jgi:hypothetical protein
MEVCFHLLFFHLGLEFFHVILSSSNTVVQSPSRQCRPFHQIRIRIADLSVIMAQLNVNSVPTLVAMYGGSILDVRVGNMKSTELKDFLGGLVSATSRTPTEAEARCTQVQESSGAPARGTCGVTPRES